MNGEGGNELVTIPLSLTTELVERHLDFYVPPPPSTVDPAPSASNHLDTDLRTIRTKSGTGSVTISGVSDHRSKRRLSSRSRVGSTPQLLQQAEDGAVKKGRGKRREAEAEGATALVALSRGFHLDSLPPAEKGRKGGRRRGDGRRGRRKGAVSSSVISGGDGIANSDEEFTDGRRAREEYLRREYPEVTRELLDRQFVDRLRLHEPPVNLLMLDEILLRKYDTGVLSVADVRTPLVLSSTSSSVCAPQRVGGRAPMPRTPLPRIMNGMNRCATHLVIALWIFQQQKQRQNEEKVVVPSPISRPPPPPPPPQQQSIVNPYQFPYHQMNPYAPHQ